MEIETLNDRLAHEQAAFGFKNYIKQVMVKFSKDELVELINLSFCEYVVET
jgi:hypothetical protein